MGRPSGGWEADPDRPLKAREQLFVDGYFLHGGNQQEAARHAGYTGVGLKVRGSEIMKRANIRRAIEARREKIEAKTEVSIVRIVEQIAALALTAKHDADKLKALDMLMKHLGGYLVRVEHTGKDGGPIEHAHTLSPAERMTRVRSLLQEAAARAN